MKKLLSIILSATLAFGVIGCTPKTQEVTNDKVLRYNLGEDPKTIDPILNTSSGASSLICAAFEGLVRLDNNDKAVPGIAKSWEVSEDGLVYTFHLRDDVKWSDGTPLNANDFEYSWKLALNPNTGAEYSYQLYYIKGAKEINVDGADASTLGVKVVDDYTLEITLENATSYFLELLAFPTYMPVQKATVEANGENWANKAETYISNGPFKLAEANMKDSFVLVKNENYYDKDKIKLDKIVMTIVTEETSAYASFVSNNLEVLSSIPTPEIAGAVENGTAKIYDQLGTYFYVINVSDKQTEKALLNPKVRQAIGLAIDRNAIVENVTKAGQVPAYSFVPPSVKDANGEKITKEYYDTKGNIEEAKKLLAEAGYPEGKGIGTITFLYNTEGSHGDIAQVVQQMLKEIGLDISLQNQEWKVFLTTRQSLDYQFARHGWLGDYTDPMTFLDMWVTGGGNNAAGYANPKYDELIFAAQKEKDVAKRTEMLREAEDILMADMPIIPIYYYTKVVAVKPEVKGLKVSSMGTIYFDEVSIEK